MEEFITNKNLKDQNFALVSFLSSSDQLINEKNIYGTCIVRGVFKDEQSAKEKAIELMSNQKKGALFREIHIVEVGKPFPICGDAYRFSQQVKILHQDIDGKILNSKDEDVIDHSLFEDQNNDSLELEFIKNCNIAGDIKQNIKSLTESLKQRLNNIDKLKKENSHNDLIEKSLNIINNDKLLSETMKQSISEKVKFFS